MRSFGIALVALMSLLSPAFAQDVNKEIGDAATLVAQALLSGNAAAITSAATPDFQFTDLFGKSGVAAAWVERAKSVHSTSRDLKLVSTTAFGEERQDNTAAAIIRMKISGVGTDRLGEEGPLDVTVTYRTVWAMDGAGWKLKSVKEARYDGTANRRPLSFSRSKADEDTRKGFQAMYISVAEIYEKRDWEKIEKGIADDFVIHDLEGKQLTKTELLDRVKAGTNVVTNPIVTIDPQQVAFEGDKLIVVRVMRLIGDAMLPGGKTGRVIYINVARDTFVRVDKDWKPRASDEVHAEATLNGIPIPLALVSGK